MKTIVIYETGTGFTAKYAAWIAQELQCEAKELKKTSAVELQSYDRVIFGGWIMGNGIAGLDKLRAMNLPMNAPKVIFFAVGASPASEAVISTIKEQNRLGNTPFFYFQGGMNFEKMGFVKKTILKTIRKSIINKENKTEQDLFMEKALSESFDASNQSYIVPLVEFAGKQ